MEKYIVTESKVQYIENGVMVWEYRFKNAAERNEIIEHLGCENYTGAAVVIEKKAEVNELKKIKKELLETIKGEDEIEVAVKVFKDENEVYEVEIACYIDGTYTDAWFDGNEFGQEDEALKRAQAVLKSVNGWFKDGRSIEVEETIESYWC